MTQLRILLSLANLNTFVRPQKRLDCICLTCLPHEKNSIHHLDAGREDLADMRSRLAHRASHAY